MRFKNIILSFLLVLTVSSLTRANDPGMRSSLRVTLEQLNRLKKVFKTAPLSPSLKTLENSDSLPIPKDLDKSQLVEEVLSQDTPESQPPKSNLSVLQSLYVKSDRIIIYSIGDDPTIVVDAEKEPGMTNITLQGVQIDPRFKLFQNSDQTEPSIGFVQVNAIAPSNSEDMTTASVEISIKTDHKNWQLIPRQGGFLLSKSDSPVNSDISSIISEPTSPEVSQVISKTVSNADPALDQGMTIDSGIPSVNELVPSTKSESVVENPVTPVQAVEDNLPVQQSLQAKISETLPPDVTNTESFFKSSIPTERPSTEISQTVDYPVPLSQPDNSDIPENSMEITPTQEESVEENIPTESYTTVAVPEITTPLSRHPIRLVNLTTANQLKTGESYASYGQTQTLRGGFGTGNQTYYTYSDWGLTDNLQVGWAWMLNDDPTYNEINGVNIPQQYQSMGPNIKYRFYQDDHWSLAILGALEQFQIYSGPGLFNNYESPTVSNTLAGTIQIPISYDVTDNFQLTLSPGVNIFSNSLNGVPFYGTILNLGAGANWQVADNLSLFANTTIPFTGGNAFNTSRQFSKQIIWSVGGTLAFNKAIAVELHFSNSFGGTPTTGLLTLPTASNEILLGGSFILIPSAKEKRDDIVLSDRNERLLFDWFTLTTPYVLPTDDYGLRLAGDSGGTIGGSISYGFLQDYQIDLAFSSIGGFDTSTVLGSQQGTNTQWRLGGKLIYLNQSEGDPFSISGRLTFGRDFGNKQGYMMVEFPMMYELNPQWAFLFSPKTAINGGNTPVGIGLGVNYQMIPEVQLIGEVTPIVTGERTVWAAGIRIFPVKNIAIDLLGTNSTSQFDLGELIAEPGTRFSASIQWRR
jgi:hypothetical protein